MIELKATLIRQQSLAAAIGYDKVYISGEEYDGPYAVFPSLSEDIELPTEDKQMRDDVTVFKVPYAAVSNPYGGETITIG